MNAKTVIKLYKLFKIAKISVWIDGGWGIDALIGKQTRIHSDLDIVIEKKNLSKLSNLLFRLSYQKQPREDTRDWNFAVVKNSDIIDIHVIEFDKLNRGIYGPKENNVFYPDYAFGYTGTILGAKVKCISPKYQLESHCGYELRQKDYEDISKLHNHFGLNL